MLQKLDLRPRHSRGAETGAGAPKWHGAEPPEPSREADPAPGPVQATNSQEEGKAWIPTGLSRLPARSDLCDVSPLFTGRECPIVSQRPHDVQHYDSTSGISMKATVF